MGGVHVCVGKYLYQILKRAADAQLDISMYNEALKVLYMIIIYFTNIYFYKKCNFRHSGGFISSHSHVLIC